MEPNEVKPEREYNEVCKHFCEAVSALLSHSQTPGQLKQHLDGAMLYYIKEMFTPSFCVAYEQAGELVINALSARPAVEPHNRAYGVCNDDLPF